LRCGDAEQRTTTSVVDRESTATAAALPRVNEQEQKQEDAAAEASTSHLSTDELLAAPAETPAEIMAGFHSTTTRESLTVTGQATDPGSDEGGATTELGEVCDDPTAMAGSEREHRVEDLAQKTEEEEGEKPANELQLKMDDSEAAGQQEDADDKEDERQDDGDDTGCVQHASEEPPGKETLQEFQTESVEERTGKDHMQPEEKAEEKHEDSSETDRPTGQQNYEDERVKIDELMETSAATTVEAQKNQEGIGHDG